MYENLHMLQGQNLLRHRLLEDFLKERGYILVSDSIQLKKLFLLLLMRPSPIKIHALELYTISFTAWKSELHFRVEQASRSPLRLAALLVRFSKLYIKLIVFKILLINSDLIVSSNSRKTFILHRGFSNKIHVIRNKPVVRSEPLSNATTRSGASLVGNLNNRELFADVVLLCKKMNCCVDCYGISNTDKIWLRNQTDKSHIQVKSAVAADEVPSILRRSRYSICLYSNTSINQRYSSSSKIFEILYHGCTPIVNDNDGLLEELKQLNADYLLIDGDTVATVYSKKFTELERSQLTFDTELENFRHAF